MIVVPGRVAVSCRAADDPVEEEHAASTKVSAAAPKKSRSFTRSPKSDASLVKRGAGLPAEPLAIACVIEYDEPLRAVQPS
jgi:hypothetical protein